MQTASVRPLITLTTDFGLREAYVAEMKAAIFTHCPEANVVDITHLIPPQDILAGSIALERAVRAFPPGTVHVAVVDPGVGTDRRILHVKINDQHVLAPDNGLISWPLQRWSGAVVYELAWRPESTVSTTFHGRDILAPAAAMIANGSLGAGMSVAIKEYELLKTAVARTHADARIIAIDHFGNAITNVPGELLPSQVRINGKMLLHKTYAVVPRGVAVAVIGSSGLLELSVNGGNAAKAFRLRVGQKVSIQ